MAAERTRRAPPLLSLNNVEVVYDGVILVLKGVSIAAPDGRITALLGANGAGKTTTLKAISGILRAERGEVVKGSIEFGGERIDRLPPHDSATRGLARLPPASRHRDARHRAGVRGPARIRAPDGRRKPSRRRAHGDRPEARARRNRPRLHLLSGAEGTPRAGGRLSLGRRAADARDRPRPDVAAEADDVRRAFARAR